HAGQRRRSMGLAHSTQNLAPDGFSCWHCGHCMRTLARGPVLYAKARYTRKLCGVMCHQGEVIGEGDRRDQQIALSDRPAAEEVSNPRVVLRGATIESHDLEGR